MASNLAVSVVTGNNVTIGTKVKAALDALNLATTKLHGYSTAALGDKIVATIVYDST
jgi:hypothetical protein